MVYFVVFFKELDDDGWVCPETKDVMRYAKEGPPDLTISKVERREDVTHLFVKEGI